MHRTQVHSPALQHSDFKKGGGGGGGGRGGGARGGDDPKMVPVGNGALEQ